SSTHAAMPGTAPPKIKPASGPSATIPTSKRSVHELVGITRLVDAAGFDILANKSHATKDKDTRPFIVARRT
ncbi:hypothetical protein VQ042_25325, partial [Aurantimonas sp. A2-1-M11]